MNSFEFKSLTDSLNDIKSTIDAVSGNSLDVLYFYMKFIVISSISTVRIIHIYELVHDFYPLSKL